MERLVVSSVVSAAAPTTSGRGIGSVTTTAFGTAAGRVSGGAGRAALSPGPARAAAAVGRLGVGRMGFASFSCRSGPSGAPAWTDGFDPTADDDAADADDDASPRLWDVVGLGQAIVDFSATVSDEFVRAAGAPKGGRRVITVEERSGLISGLDGGSFAVNAGGSLSNTLVALARLGRADGAPLRVALGGGIGRDALGEFYRARTSRAGLRFLSRAEPASATGTVVVLTTPDAHRTFLSFPGTPHDLAADAAATAAAASARVLVVEGYLWETPGAWEGIGHAIATAKRAGALVAMTAGDVGVVERHRDAMRTALGLGVDAVFANAAEASCLMSLPSECAEGAAAALGRRVPLGVVTDGSRGAFLAGPGPGRVQHVAPHWSEERPVDTNGAGDAFAAGVLYGLLKGHDVQTMGRFGARVASAVISRVGARLEEDDALTLVREMAEAEAEEGLGALEREVSTVVPTKVGGASLRLRTLAPRALQE